MNDSLVVFTNLSGVLQKYSEHRGERERCPTKPSQCVEKITLQTTYLKENENDVDTVEEPKGIVQHQKGGHECLL